MKKIYIPILITIVSLLDGILFFWKEILLFFCTAAGYSSLYTREGELLLQYGNKNVTVSIYRSQNVPYTLIGPVPFREQEDFLFVRKTEVAGRILDEKVRGDFFRLWKWLFILFDLSSKPDAMAPSFLFKTKIRYDEKLSGYFYEIYLDDSPETERKIYFFLDKKFLPTFTEQANFQTPKLLSQF